MAWPLRRWSRDSDDRQYRVVVYYREIEEQWFLDLAEAREYADWVVQTIGIMAVVYPPRSDEALYHAGGIAGHGYGPDQGGGDPHGVREPRRPLPGSSSHGVALDRPE